MRCSQCQKLIHLYGPGELSNRQKRRVEKHLGGCNACREVAGEVRRAAGEIRSLRGLQPELPRPEAFTGAILRRIRSEHAGQRPSRLAGGLEAVMDWVGTPFARGALVGIAMLIICLFAAQEALIVHRLNRLEQAVGSGNRATVGSRQYPSLEDVLNTLDQAASGRDKELRAILGQVPTDSLLHEYQRLRRENDLLKRLILEHYPELDRYLAGKPVTAKQLETLLRDYPGYINLLRRL